MTSSLDIDTQGGGMHDPEAYAERSAAVIGRAMAAGGLNPVAFAEYLFDRIASQTSPVFLTVTRDRAMAEARAAEARLRAGQALSPLDGVPVAWKDLIDMKGERTTAGSAIYGDAPPAARDAPIVAHATVGGMVNLGKVNLTEFAYSGLGLNPHFGTPVNPHDQAEPRAPGGSSSGSAVAVAAGLAPVAVGTDTGGSVRIPAAFNGLVGFKCSEGRISPEGVFALSETLDTIGPLARTVEDCILTEMVLRGAMTSDVRRGRIDDMRIFVPQSVVLDDLDPAVAANFEAAIDRLVAGGAKITSGTCEEFDRAYDLAGRLGTITAAEAYARHKSLIDNAARNRIDRRVAARIEAGKRMKAADLITLHRTRRKDMQSLAARLNGAFLAMPTTPHTAPKIAPLDADDDRFHKVNLKTLRNTAIGNFLNLPGVAIPNGTDTKGLPTSFLLSDCGGNDDRLLGAALAVDPIIRQEISE